MSPIRQLWLATSVKIHSSVKQLGCLCEELPAYCSSGHRAAWGYSGWWVWYFTLEKIKDDVFTMDYRQPLSAFQAFCNLRHQFMGLLIPHGMTINMNISSHSWENGNSDRDRFPAPPLFFLTNMFISCDKHVHLLWTPLVLLAHGIHLFFLWTRNTHGRKSKENKWRPQVAKELLCCR